MANQHKVLTAIQIIWTVAALTVCTAVGALYGWQQNGVTGAIAYGLAGLCIGAVIAAAPSLFLGIF